MVLLIQQHVQGYMQRRHAHCMQNAARMLTNAQASTSMIRTPMRHGAKHQAAAADSATTDDQQQDENSSTNDDIEWIEIAKISVHHGVRGEVKVQPLTDFAPQRLGRPGTRYLLPPAGPLRHAAPVPVPITLQRGRSIVYKGHDMWLVKLSGYDTPESVRELRNYTLLIREDERDPDEDLEGDHEFYVQELVGMDVILASTGTAIGTVVSLYDGTVPTNAHSEDVAKGAVRTVLLPFARDIVPEVDLDEGRMVIDPPAGLLEATLTVEKGARHVAPSKRRRAAARRRAIEDARQRAARA